MVLMNTSSAPFDTKEFGNKVIESAVNFWETAHRDPDLRVQYHEELCFDRDLDSDKAGLASLRI